MKTRNTHPGELLQWEIDRRNSSTNALERAGEILSEQYKSGYTRGFHDALCHLEMISLIVPDKRLTAKRVIEMAQKQVKCAVAMWRKNVGIE